LTERYVLQRGAAEDLRSIVRYTKETWGVDQAKAYTEKLRLGLERAADDRGTYKTLGDIHRDLRVMRCEHHYIFYLWRAGALPRIIAILHERMDLISRVSDRLS
jgi:plasmid stabilization system protein ParE